tara:strand:+ start:7597 stop:7857 length:261 start_codon:yes stop_codon:yes gene_type:complete
VRKMKGGRTLGYKPYSAGDMKHVGWCLNNNIGVCAIPDWKTPTAWNIIVRIGTTYHPDPKGYTAPDAINKIYEYYEYYYKKGIQHT